MRFAFAFTALVFALNASGQIVEIRPANPTSLDPVTLTIGTPYSGCDPGSVTTVNNLVTVTLVCDDPLPAGGEATVSIGRFPAGTYSIIVALVAANSNPLPAPFLTFPPVPLLVTQGAIVPAIDGRGILLLIAVLIGAGTYALRR